MNNSNKQRRIYEIFNQQGSKEKSQVSWKQIKQNNTQKPENSNKEGEYNR